PDELDTIERLAEENFAGFEAALERHGIDAEWELTGTLSVAAEPHQVPWLEEMARTSTDPRARLLRGDELRAYADSPLFHAGFLSVTGNAFVHPAKLAWGLADAAERLGVEIVEHTPALRLRTSGDAVEVVTRHGV